jgi:cell wall-associated NlpC family hydrolase
MKITVHCINKDNMAYWQCAKNTMKDMDFERDYLPGVVAAEMGDCQEIEALKAQAIAGRSFAYQYILKNAAIYDTGKAQAYLASRAVSKTYLLHRQAAEDTAGIIVTLNGKPCNTHYSASNGGYVKKSSNKWEPGGYVDPWDNGKLSGHGSGMSQTGAKNMAKAGKSYAEILQFYYHGTVLMGEYGKAPVAENITTETEVDNMTAMQKVIAFARAQLGEPYDLGDHGPDKWDCSGLTMEAVKQIGLTWPHSSHTQYYNNIKSGGDFDAYGTLDALPAGKSAFLFHYGKRTNGQMGMVHVGVLDGESKNIIQAGGYNGTGVHENPYADCKSHWSHWATLKVANGPMGETAETTPAAETPAAIIRPTIYMRSSGNEAWKSAVRELQTLLNQKNEAGLKVDGIFGKITRKSVIRYQEMNGLVKDGIVGPKTWAKLTA